MSDANAIVNLNIHKKRFKEWLQNYYTNLPYMRKEPDIENLPPARGRFGIVIGNGPSLEREHHLEQLANLENRPTIFATDTSFKKCLTAGFHPDYVVTGDSSPILVPYLDVKAKDSQNVTLIINAFSDPKIRRNWHGFVHWYIDDIGAQLLCPHPFSAGVALSILAGDKTCIRPGGNIGSCAMMIAHMIGYTPLVLIGMDCSLLERGSEEDSWVEGVNPYWGNKYWMSTIWQVYRGAILERIDQLGMKVVNCTGAGSLFGPKITCMNLKDFLANPNRPS